VVIEPVEDLHVGFVSQPPVDEVRLPQLVGLGGLKTDVGAPRALAGLRDDQPGVMQNPPDRRGRQDPKLLLLECQRIVSGPASSPSAVSARRSSSTL
jgi:hypothetical protein